MTEQNCLSCYYFNGPEASCEKFQCGVPHEVVVVGCVDGAFKPWFQQKDPDEQISYTSEGEPI